MSLTGNLEDLPLLDIIQIVSFSRKTGYLSIEMSKGQGGIVFREGLVVSAFTADSPPIDPRFAALPADRRDKAIRSRIAFALEQMARLREGAFGFELTEDVPRVLGERDISPETLAGGINPQNLLLDLTSGIDDARAESAAAVEASFATPDEGVFDEERETDRPVVPSTAFASDLVGSGTAEATTDEPPADESIDAAVDRAFEGAAEAVESAGEAVPKPPEVAPESAGAAEHAGEAVLDAAEVAPRPADARPDATDVAPESAGAEPAVLEPDRPDAEGDDAAAWAPSSPAYSPQTMPLKPVRLPEAPSAQSPAAPEPSPEPEVARVILLVDDEEDVRQILGRHFASAGFHIEEAGDPETAAKVAIRLREASSPFVVVTDLGMPASGGASFHGGFEVVKRLWKMNLRPPVVMMTENLSQSLRLRARQMGVQAFVFKPTLSKLNPRQYEADLSAFAFKLSADVLPRLAARASLRPVPHRRRDFSETGAPPPGPAPAPEDATRPFEFLRRRLAELRQPEDANQIAVLVMKVAREFFERAILFVIKNDEARGLGGFGLAPRDETLNLLARTVAIPLGDPSIFHEVARERRPFAGVPASDRWLGHLMGRIGRFHSRGIVLLPLVAHRETIALLFGDSPETGRDVGGLDALEVFVHQAGIALENVFLQKKLQAMQERDGPGVR